MPKKKKKPRKKTVGKKKPVSRRTKKSVSKKRAGSRQKPLARRRTKPKRKRKPIKARELLAGLVFIGIGAVLTVLGVNILSVPNYQTDNLVIDSKNPQVLGQEAITREPANQEIKKENPCCGQTADEQPVLPDQEKETATKVDSQVVAADQDNNEENEAEPAEPAVEAEPADQRAIAEPKLEADLPFAPANLDPAFCQNYTFYQVTGQDSNLASSSLILREKDNGSAVTLVETLSEVTKSADQYILLANQADKQTCRYLFFSRKNPDDNALKEGLFTYNLQDGSFSELPVSSSFRGYTNYRFAADLANLLIVHDNAQLNDQQGTIEVISLPQGNSRQLVQLKDGETFHSGQGTTGLSASFGWSEDMSLVYFDVYQKEGEQYNFLETRRVNF